MNKDAIADFKQFITATVSQQLTDLREELRKDIHRVEKKIDDLSDSVANALEASNQATESQLKNHEQRITRLEQQTA